EAETLGVARRFDTFSGALGLAWSPMPGLRLGLNGSRAARAPSAEELFADRPHIATQQYEIGNPELRQETAWGLEGYARARFGGADLGLSIYGTWFDVFVYLHATGVKIDELSVYRLQLPGADYFGIDAQATSLRARLGCVRMVGDVEGDYVRATLPQGDHV